MSLGGYFVGGCVLGGGGFLHIIGATSYLCIFWFNRKSNSFLDRSVSSSVSTERNVSESLICR
jgi:hypothetical protein